jgi:predicted GIY-YIG superfamily endonuclease
MYCVYLLCHSSNRCTYVGITNNLERRIRQHNGELVGGAKYTKMKKQDGNWRVYGKITDLDKSIALSIEKKIHLRTKKTKGPNPLEKRINCIDNVLKEYDSSKKLILEN